MFLFNVTYLRVPNQHDLGVWTSAVQAVHGRHDGRRALRGRAVVVDTAACCLPATGRVRDGRGLAVGVRGRHHAHEPARRAVSCRGRRLARPEDVYAWAGLALFDGVGGRDCGQDGEDGGRGLHLEFVRRLGSWRRMDVTGSYRQSKTHGDLEVNVLVVLHTASQR